MSTDNNSLKTPYDEAAIVGLLETLPPPLLELAGDYIRALLAGSLWQTKTSSSITSNPLYSPTSDSPTGMSTSQDYTWARKDGQSYVLPVTELKPSESEQSALKQDDYVEQMKEQFQKDQEIVNKLQGNKGLKHDGEKPPLAYIPLAALFAEGEAFKYGAGKYAPFNYKNGIAVTRTLSAALRHIVQFLNGEDVDAESGVNHLGCARANLAMALDTLANHPQLDDRFKGEK